MSLHGLVRQLVGVDDMRALVAQVGQDGALAGSNVARQSNHESMHDRA